MRCMLHCVAPKEFNIVAESAVVRCFSLLVQIFTRETAKRRVARNFMGLDDADDGAQADDDEDADTEDEDEGEEEEEEEEEDSGIPEQVHA